MARSTLEESTASLDLAPSYLPSLGTVPSKKNKAKSLSGSYEFVNSRQLEARSNSIRLDLNEALFVPSSSHTNKANNKLLRDLHYGDILFRCTSFNS